MALKPAEKEGSSIEELIEENKALRSILLGATMTINISDSVKQQILVEKLVMKNSREDTNKAESHLSSVVVEIPSEGTKMRQSLLGNDDSNSSTKKGRSSSDNEVLETASTMASTEPSLTQSESVGTVVAKDKPIFTKKDFLSVLEEKNVWKEKSDQLEEELEEWKRAALNAQERVEALETEIAEVQQRLGGFYYKDEVQADVLGILPKGPNFRPQPLAEVSELYVTDVEVSGWVQQESKFLFAIQVTWSDKRRFEIYRRYAEFFTLQNTLLLLFPEEAGKRKSAKRIIPSLPTVDNVLAIFGATNRKKAVESRLQLIDSYCNTILLQLPKKIARSPLLYDFFKARPSDKQLESLKRPLHHSMELSVYPLTPQGKSQELYVAIASFEATKDSSKSNQIPLQVRDCVRLVKEDESGWAFVQKPETGECGFVPLSFLRRVGDPSIPEASIDTSVLGFVTSTYVPDTNTNKQTSTQDEDRDSIVSISPDMKYLSIYPYEANDPCQLSFPEGVEIVVIDKSEDGWWFGTYGGKEGWIPSTYLETTGPNQEMEEEGVNEIEGQEFLTTNNYTAKDEDEISLPSGVRVVVLEKSFTGWWRVKYRKNVGYAPATVLQQSSQPNSPGEEPASSLTLSIISGMKKPPPRRKHVQKKRAQTLFMNAIEEKEEALLTATTVCEDSGIMLKNRRTSIKDFLRRAGTLESKKTRKSATENQQQNSSTYTRSSTTNVNRDDELANLSLLT